MQNSIARSDNKLHHHFVAVPRPYMHDHVLPEGDIVGRFVGAPADHGLVGNVRRVPTSQNLPWRLLAVSDWPVVRRARASVTELRGFIVAMAELLAADVLGRGAR